VEVDLCELEFGSTVKTRATLAEHRELRHGSNSKEYSADGRRVLPEWRMTAEHETQNPFSETIARTWGSKTAEVTI
jgi:hypothetical protein